MNESAAFHCIGMAQQLAETVRHLVVYLWLSRVRWNFTFQLSRAFFQANSIIGNHADDT